MEITQKICNLYHTYTQPDYCPSLSQVVKSVTCVAGAILGWRYAPKITFIIVAGAALYYGMKFLWPSLPDNRTPPTVEEISPPSDQEKQPQLFPVDDTSATSADLSSLEAPPLLPRPPDESPLAVAPDPQAPIEPAYFKEKITLAKEFKALLKKAIANPHTDISQAFDYLYRKKPDTLDILAWNPPIPGTDKYQPNSPSQSDALLKEETFMQSVFFLSATLDHHKDIRDKFIPLFKKKEGLLSNCKLREFIIKVIFLSRYEKIDNIARISQATHPLDEAPFGIASYIRALACQQWYLVTGNERFIRSLDDIEQNLPLPQNPLDTLTNSHLYNLSFFLSGKIVEFRLAITIPLGDYEYTEISGISSLEKISKWIDSVLQGEAPEEDIISLFSFLSHNLPTNLDILSWNPLVPGTKEFNQILEPFLVSLYTSPILLLKYWNDNRLNEKTRNEIKDTMGSFSQVEPLLSRIQLPSLESVLPTISQITDEADKQASFMEIVFSLAALLERFPDLAKNVIERLRPLNDPLLEESLKDKGLRSFIIKILWLSGNKEAVCNIITANNPEKAPERIAFFESHQHPVNVPTTNVYSYFIPLVALYKINKENVIIEKITDIRTEIDNNASNFDSPVDLAFFDALQTFITPKLDKFFASIKAPQ